MLNIPETVKALIDSDSVAKNFRVQFPNGEMADLTNVNILRESVKFTESICSRESFRFGLAERSVMEFETIGIGDMRGLTIQCFCEVCVNSLTSAEISDIQAGTWDGELVTAEASDIGYAFFRIPYGIFVVAECPRNQETMTRRRVKAYSVDYFTEPNPFEINKLACPIFETGEQYAPYILPLSLAQLCQANDAPVLAAGYTKTETVISSSGTLTNLDGITVQVKNTDGDVLQIRVTRGARTSPGGYNNEFQNLYGIEYDKANLRAFVGRIDSWLDSLNVDWSVPATVAGAVSVSISTPAELRRLVGNQFQVYDGVAYGNITAANMYLYYNAFEPFYWFHHGTGNFANRAALMDYSVGSVGKLLFYPWGMKWANGDESTTLSGGITIPTNVEISVTNVTAGTTASHTERLISPPAGRELVTAKYAPPSSHPLLNMRVSFEPNGKEPYVSSFTGCYDPAKLTNDFLEIQAQFALPARTGAVDIFRPDPNTPVAAQPSDYRSFWWDEHSAAAPGRIRFLLALGAEDFVVDYIFGNGAAIYDMSDNTLLRDVGMTQQEAIDFLMANLIPFLSTLTLDTVELEARGRPQVESGDFLTVTAEDGSTFLACITRRELRGVQILTDDIETVSFQANTQVRAARTYSSDTPIAGKTILYNGAKSTSVPLSDDWSNYDLLVLTWITNVDIYAQVIEVSQIQSGRNYFTGLVSWPPSSLQAAAYVTFPAARLISVSGSYSNNTNWTLGIISVTGVRL